MGPAETYEAQVALMAILNNLWEIWLGGTAAFIVAFHVGRESITKPLVWVGCILYLAACFSIVMRYGAYVDMIGSMNQQMIEAGQKPFPIPVWFGAPNMMLTIVIFSFGTLSAVFFAVSQYRKRDV